MDRLLPDRSADVDLVDAFEQTSRSQVRLGMVMSVDGSVTDEHGWVVMGGQADRLAGVLGGEWRPGMTLAQVLGLAVRVLGSAEPDGDARVLGAAQLEVAVLDRTRPRRAFRRLTGALLEDVLGGTQDPVDGGDGPPAS